MTIFSRDLTRRPLMPMMLTVGLLAMPAVAFSQAATTPTPGTGAPTTGTGTMGTGAMGTGAMGTGMTGTQATRPGAMGRSAATKPMDARRASQVIGSSVYNEQGDDIGTVDDVLLGAQSTGPTAVLSVGGFLGIGARLVSVPMSSLTWHADRERWVMSGATKESLQARPAFDYDARG